MGKGRIIGIGGIFFKSENPDKLKQWYGNFMGMKIDQYGANFISKKVSNPTSNSFLQWSLFPKDTDYIPENQPYMVNYRVENIESLVDDLKLKGVKICDEIATYDYGKFVHVLDGEGNKVELWEPVDEVFDAYVKDLNDTNYE